MGMRPANNRTRTAAGGAGAIPPELVALAQGLGLDPTTMAGLAGAGGDIDDSPPVWVGERRRTTPVRRLRTGDPNRRFEVTGGEEVVEENLQTANRTYMRFWEWDDAKLTGFQEKAFAAGLYGTTDRRKVRWGDRDSATEAIWRDMVDRAAAFYQAGRKVSPWDALDMASSASPGLDELEGDEPPKLVNELDIRTLGNTRGQARLGRELTDEEQANLIGRFRAMEAAANAEGATTAAPDMEAWADQEIKRLDPVRYGARNVLSSWDAIVSAFRGGA